MPSTSFHLPPEKPENIPPKNSRFYQILHLWLYLHWLHWLYFLHFCFLRSTDHRITRQEAMTACGNFQCSPVPPPLVPRSHPLLLLPAAPHGKRVYTLHCMTHLLLQMSAKSACSKFGIGHFLPMGLSTV